MGVYSVTDASKCGKGEVKLRVGEWVFTLLLTPESVEKVR